MNNSLISPNPMLATAPHDRVSAKYKFIDSSKLAWLLGSHGWAMVGQKNARSVKYAGFQKHLMMKDIPLLYQGKVKVVITYEE